MARAHRLATILAVLTSFYALLFFAILPVPFVHEDVAVKVLPTVCRFSGILFQIQCAITHILPAFASHRFHGGPW
jgi:hypothetical protein